MSLVADDQNRRLLPFVKVIQIFQHQIQFARIGFDHFSSLFSFIFSLKQTIHARQEKSEDRRVKREKYQNKPPIHLRELAVCFGAPAGTRTLDTRLKRAMLYRLSYGSVFGYPTLQRCFSKWQGWLDSNQRMTESKSVALPLGYTPMKEGGEKGNRNRFPFILWGG